MILRRWSDMINAVVTAAVLIINFILQTTVLQLIEIRGVIPDTMLIIIVSYSLLWAERRRCGRIFRRSALRYIFRKRSRILCFVRYAYRLFMRNSPQEFLQGRIMCFPVTLSAIASFVTGLVIYVTGFC